MICPDFDQAKATFRVHVSKDSRGFVDIGYISNDNFSFLLKDNLIEVSKEKKYRGIKSYKPKDIEVKKSLLDNGFRVNDMLGTSNKIKMFVCKKNMD
jgi:hypothetical protein